MSEQPAADWTQQQRREYRDQLRLTFGAEAALYERSRPGFPLEAARWLVPDGAHEAVDVGAGTGKFTRCLRDAGLEVAAVEPDAGMRAELQRVLPDVRCLEGTGESNPLGDESVDLVTFAQAWHWVDSAEASREVARVLRPGGTLGLIWNLDAEVPRWMAEGLRHEKPLESEKVDPEVAAPFGELEHAVFPWSEQIAKETFIDRVMSRSKYLRLSADERSAEADRLRAAMVRDPDVADQDYVVLEHATHCFRVRRPG